MYFQVDLKDNGAQHVNQTRENNKHCLHTLFTVYLLACNQNFMVGFQSHYILHSATVALVKSAQDFNVANVYILHVLFL